MAETCNQLGRQHRVSKQAATRARRGETLLEDPVSFGVPEGDPRMEGDEHKVKVALARCDECGKYVSPDARDVEVADG